jgi:hypothetical protein
MDKLSTSNNPHKVSYIYHYSSGYMEYNYEIAIKHSRRLSNSKKEKRQFFRVFDILPRTVFATFIQ